MENQHRKITGYRELDETEIALMNKIKALGPQIEDVVKAIMEHVSFERRLNDEAPQARITEQQRINAAQPERWLAMGRSGLQTGLMKLTRAVAQPGFF